MNAQQLFNEAVAFTVGSKTLHFRRLSALRLAAVKQAAYLSKLYSDMASTLDSMPGGHTPERFIKVHELRNALPIGFAFVSGAEELSNKTPPDAGIYRLLAEANVDGLKADEIQEAFSDGTFGQADAIFAHVFTSRKERLWSDKLIRLLTQHLAADYGYTPHDMMSLTDEQIIDLVPSLAQSEDNKAAAAARIRELEMEQKAATVTPPIEGA